MSLKIISKLKKRKIINLCILTSYKSHCVRNLSLKIFVKCFVSHDFNNSLKKFLKNGLFRSFLVPYNLIFFFSFKVNVFVVVFLL